MENRIYKFRAYSKRKNIIFEVGSLELNENYITDKERKIYLKEDVEIMQFTGLLDKNGVRIYEGDVVETPHKLFKKYKWEVLFHKGAFVLADKVGGGFRRFDSEKWTKSYEIIGNVWENPDLLKP